MQRGVESGWQICRQRRRRRCSKGVCAVASPQIYLASTGLDLVLERRAHIKAKMEAEVLLEQHHCTLMGPPEPFFLDPHIAATVKNVKSCSVSFATCRRI